MKYRPDAIRFIDGENTFLDEIKGYGFEKYAVAAACAGRHNIMLFGSFGSGPRVPLVAGMMELLPVLLSSETEEVRRIYTEADESLPAPEGARPFRLPSAKDGLAEMLGGGNGPKPGEASLARQDRLNSRLPKEALEEACLHLETTLEQAEALHRMDRREVLSVTSLAMTVADMEGHPKAGEEDVEMALRLHGGLDAVLRTAGIKKEEK